MEDTPGTPALNGSLAAKTISGDIRISASPGLLQEPDCYSYHHTSCFYMFFHFQHFIVCRLELSYVPEISKSHALSQDRRRDLGSIFENTLASFILINVIKGIVHCSLVCHTIRQASAFQG